MDATGNFPSTRKFPSYTLANLKAWVAEGRGTPEIEAEIAAREAGASTVTVTPQLKGGTQVPRIGRM